MTSTSDNHDSYVIAVDALRYIDAMPLAHWLKAKSAWFVPKSMIKISTAIGNVTLTSSYVFSSQRVADCDHV